ncbi:MAG: hypothetical protein GC136_07390 [Alphaproteobacteria bacterium]|nr:hypothetical protein [Alphaproteobacteria bacterium]
MRKIYDISHTNQMSWEEFDSIVKNLIEQVKDKKFDAIAPILRSGSIPATIIANKLKITSFIPLQLKYAYPEQDITVKIPPTIPTDINSQDPLKILVVECNTSSGKAARKAYELLHSTFPNSELHYACVTKVSLGSNAPETLTGYQAYYVGRHTNELFLEPDRTDLRHGITIYPWETAEYELEDINHA